MLHDIYKFAGRNVIEISVTMPSPYPAVPRVSSLGLEPRTEEQDRILELGPDVQLMHEIRTEEMLLVAPEIPLAAQEDALLAPEVPQVAPVIQEAAQPPALVEEFPFVVPDALPRRTRRRRR